MQSMFRKRRSRIRNKTKAMTTNTHGTSEITVIANDCIISNATASSNASSRTNLHTRSNTNTRFENNPFSDLTIRPYNNAVFGLKFLRRIMT